MDDDVEHTTNVYKSQRLYYRVAIQRLRNSLGNEIQTILGAPGPLIRKLVWAIGILQNGLNLSKN